LLYRFFDGVEYGQSLDQLAGFAWGHTTDHFSSVLFATFGVKGACFARDSLANDSRIAIYKNAHIFIV